MHLSLLYCPSRRLNNNTAIAVGISPREPVTCRSSTSAAPVRGTSPRSLSHFRHWTHDAPTMSSTNFAAAQERVLERRRLREAEARTRFAQQQQQRTSAVHNAALNRLPYPFNKLPQSGFWLWNAISGREGIRPAFRVGQVDAELLDEELLGLLQGQVGEGLKYFGVSKHAQWNFTQGVRVNTG